MFLKFILFTNIFAFKHVIPLEIVSFILPATSSLCIPKIRNPFASALFIGGRRVEGNYNALGSLHFEGRSDVSMERVRNYIC